MNLTYAFAPFLLTAAFAGLYLPYERRIEHEQAVARAAAEQARLEAARLREQTERESLARQQALVVERETAAREKERQRVAAQQARDDELRRTLDAAISEQEALTIEHVQLEARLAEVRRDREDAGRQLFALQQAVEQQRIDRRTADLEIQRATQHLAERIDEKTLAESPLFPAPDIRPPVR